MLQLLFLFLAATTAGAINSVAGGGTLISFPALMAAGFTSRIANATNTAALWPGSASSLWGYRSELAGMRKVLWWMIGLGLSGGIVGAGLLLLTPTHVFDRIVPILVLGATSLFIVQEPISRWIRSRAERPEAAAAEEAITHHLSLPAIIALFATAIYGGYFGAGIGIVTLAVLSFIGMRNIHQMNGVKNLYALCTNLIAACLFLGTGNVNWRTAFIMALGAIFGGYAGAGIARRLGQKNVRRLVIAIGLLLGLSLLRKW